MGLKKKLGLGVASAALGLSLVGGGTFAYFNDTTEVNGSFAAGTLDLNAQPTTIIDVKNIKPGDWMNRAFELKNDGTLDIDQIKLYTDYKVIDAEGNNAGEDFGDHIRVNFLHNWDKADTPIFFTTLSELKEMDETELYEKVFVPWLGTFGGYLAAGTSDTLLVQFEFVDNGKDQNKFQGDSLELTWTFEGMQGPGEAK
ncbi:CalY family protein [Bacillus carboniphilus]|uniref:CalY family protein n=1 Tax=Bacillus carboniphilus TaxID=86663 RepID=A0ABY9JXP9_9BACI|nr:CalY family protein [Bacillus carboniphilus]WLR42436.1 CalY family protein [Bacillus carboniphilus]